MDNYPNNNDFYSLFKVSIKQGNLILAILTDLALGYIALQLLPKDKVDVSSALMGVLEVKKNSFIIFQNFHKF